MSIVKPDPKRNEKVNIRSLLGNRGSIYINHDPFPGGDLSARTIDPVFFGQQGLVISVSMLVWSFTMIGEEPALLKKQDDVGNYMQMLLFIRIIIVCFLIAVMVFLWSVGWLPGSGDIKNYIIIVFLLQAFAQVGAVYMANIQKLMYFRRLALYSLVPTVTAVSLACFLAFLGYKIWALLWLIIAEQLVQVILIILLAPKIFLPKFNKPLALEFFHFSKYAVSGNLLDRFHCQIDNISVGSLIAEAFGILLACILNRWIIAICAYRGLEHDRTAILCEHAGTS